jgi:O-antigen ligase
MRGARRRRLYAIAAGALVTFVAVLVFFGRNEAFVRLRDLDATGDLRARALPVVLQMARDAFPVGIGLGSFETVYRRFEPFDQLSYTYLNQAHNDLLQVVVEAGMLGGLLLVAFIGWWGWASWRAWREAPTAQSLAARAGSAVVLMILAASVTDYPVRTPLMLAVLTIACAWMLTVRPGAREAVLEDPARDRS